MPGMRLKEVRLPELHLPEMSREEIAKTIGDARPDVDLSRLDPRRIDLSDVDVPRFDLSAVDLSRIDVPKAVAAAAQAAGLMRAARRPRLPFVIGGLVTLGIVGFAIVNSPAVKPRLVEAMRRAKERIEERRASRLAVDAATDEGSAMADPSMADAPMGASEPVAIPIEAEPFGSLTGGERSSSMPAAEAAVGVASGNGVVVDLDPEAPRA